MLPIVKRSSRFLLFVAIPLLISAPRFLLGCAGLETFFGIAAPVLAEAGAKAFSAAVDDAEKKQKRPPTDPEIKRLRKRVAALEAAERKEALERAKEKAADLRALSLMAREIADLRRELTEGLDALERSRAPVSIAVDAGAEGGAP